MSNWFATCPNDINPVKYLDTERYQGQWHEMYRVEGSKGQTGECGTVFYTDGTKTYGEGKIAIKNVELRGSVDNQKLNEIKGKLSCGDDEDYEGRCKLKFDSWFIPLAEYNVIDTDYDSYSIVYSCSKIASIYRIESFYVISRDTLEPGSKEWTDMNNKVMPKIQELFKTNVSGREKYLDTKSFLHTT